VTDTLSAAGVAFAPTLDRAALTARADNPQAAHARLPELMAACQSFEAVFLSQLMRVMRQGESKDKLFGGGMGERIYREFLDDQLASEMATTGSTGIAEMLYERLEAAALADQAPARAAHDTSGRAASGHGTDTVLNPVMEAVHDTLTQGVSP
jgi:Rod binding domain-containing protein